MAKYVYAAIFTPEREGYSIKFPDLENCYTSAPTLEEGVAMAGDILCLTLYKMEQEETPIPEPTPINEIVTREDEFATLVLCDTSAYLSSSNSKTVNKTVSIPLWLSDMAEQKGINLSSALQDALKCALRGV